jgi:hypothetical protein
MLTGKVPASTILVDAQFMDGIEMPPEHLAAPAAALSTSFRFHPSKDTSPGSPQKIDRVVFGASRLQEIFRSPQRQKSAAWITPSAAIALVRLC